jgi:hypothetical protein
MLDTRKGVTLMEKVVVVQAAMVQVGRVVLVDK